MSDSPWDADRIRAEIPPGSRWENRKHGKTYEITGQRTMKTGGDRLLVDYVDEKRAPHSREPEDFLSSFERITSEKEFPNLLVGQVLVRPCSGEEKEGTIELMISKIKRREHGIATIVVLSDGTTLYGPWTLESWPPRPYRIPSLG